MRRTPRLEQIKNHSVESPPKLQLAMLRRRLKNPLTPRLKLKELALQQSNSNRRHRQNPIATEPPPPRPISSFNKPCLIAKNFAPVYSNNSTLSL